MNDLLPSLRVEFQDEEYRYAYAQSFLNTKLASQIKTLREQRGLTQAEVASKMKIKQPGYRRFEDVNHEVWRTDSLWNIARGLGVRLDISFKTFGTLPEEKGRFSKEFLQLPKFEDDPILNPKEDQEPEKAMTAAEQSTGLTGLANAPPEDYALLRIAHKQAVNVIRGSVGSVTGLSAPSGSLQDLASVKYASAFPPAFAPAFAPPFEQTVPQIGVPEQ